jgi:acyl carrier protein
MIVWVEPMGLDTVELLLAIEEEFGIYIQNADAATCATPGQVADYVLTRVRTNHQAPCPSQQGFYKVRRALIETFAVARPEVAPTVRLASILPSNIETDWPMLWRSLGVEEFPRLKRSKVRFIGLVLLPPAVAVTPWILGGVPVPLCLIAYGLLVLLLERATRRLAREIPAEYATVAALIPFVGCSEPTVWDRAGILARVIELTSAQLGIPVALIREDSHFVHDLGAD